MIGLGSRRSISLSSMVRSLNPTRPTDRIPVVLSWVAHSAETPFTVWAYNEHTGWAALITVYRPDPQRWIDWRQRRSE